VVTAFEQVDAEGGVTLGGEPLADAADVVVKPEGLVDDHYARVRSAVIGKRQIGSAEGFACATARGATLRRDLIDVTARTARHGRGEITVHLPEGWHRGHEWMNLF